MGFESAAFESSLTGLIDQLKLQVIDMGESVDLYKGITANQLLAITDLMKE